MALLLERMTELERSIFEKMPQKVFDENWDMENWCWKPYATKELLKYQEETMVVIATMSYPVR